MGFTFSEDGECVVCKRISNKFCDACRRFVCDEHSIEVPVPGSIVTKHLFCKACYETGKKPINAPHSGKHAHYG